MMYAKYLWYVLRHKWFVFLEACKMGIPWLGLVHDLSKFRPDEFIPYAKYFYGKNAKQWREETGYYKPTDTGDEAFDFAWLLHQKRNRHHWQWWILPEDDGGTKVLPIPEKYCKEMLADWRGAGRVQGKPNTAAWYTKNKDKMTLEPGTRLWIETNFVSDRVQSISTELESSGLPARELFDASRKELEERQRSKREPTLFKIRLLKGMFGNSEGDILKVKMVDEKGDIYYYDGFHRWCYLEAAEEGIAWEKV